MAIREGLYLHQQHQLHNLLGNFRTDTASVGKHEVALQRGEVFLGDGPVAEGAEAGGHTVDGFLLGVGFLVKVGTALLHGINRLLGKFNFLAAFYNLGHLVNTEEFG